MPEQKHIHRPRGGVPGDKLSDKQGPKYNHLAQTTEERLQPRKPQSQLVSSVFQEITNQIIVSEFIIATTTVEAAGKAPDAHQVVVVEENEVADDEE